VCELLVGVAGGVSALLLCIFLASYEPRLEERICVGDPGGVETVRRFAGLEYSRPGTASLYPSLTSVLVSS
jgi:hypothetical protein